MKNIALKDYETQIRVIASGILPRGYKTAVAITQFSVDAALSDQRFVRQ